MLGHFSGHWLQSTRFEANWSGQYRRAPHAPRPAPTRQRLKAASIVSLSVFCCELVNVARRRSRSGSSARTYHELISAPANLGEDAQTLREHAAHLLLDGARIWDGKFL